MKAMFATALLSGFLLQYACTPAQLDAITQDLDQLYANRDLAERNVRALKAQFDTGSPESQSSRAEYDRARDVYNAYLDGIKTSAIDDSFAFSDDDTKELRASTSTFVAHATRTLNPERSWNDFNFSKAFVMPEKLSKKLRELPKKDRAAMIKHVERNARWRSWADI